MLCEVDRGDDLRAPGGRGEVDGGDPGFGVLLGVAHVHVGAGGVEDHVEVIAVLENPVGSLMRGVDAESLRAREAIGGRIDADQCGKLQSVAAQHLDHEVGADIAGADDGTSQRHAVIPSCRCVRSGGAQGDGAETIEVGAEDVSSHEGDGSVQCPGHDDRSGRQGDSEGVQGVGQPGDGVEGTA